jgi:hypothetical protein|tara:strand:- start:1109 stop:1339 length:231 start_codon:yes stop_codon:yes gene_type:complete
MLAQPSDRNVRSNAAYCTNSHLLQIGSASQLMRDQFVGRCQIGCQTALAALFQFVPEARNSATKKGPASNNERRPS